jgi:hypothetical protein
MKRIIYTILLASSIALSPAHATGGSEIEKAEITRDEMKRMARFKADSKRVTREARYRFPSTSIAVRDAEKLYHQMNDVRYKAQLRQEARAFTGIFAWLWTNDGDEYKAARAAQVHWKDLMIEARTRLGIAQENDKKIYTYEEERARSESRIAFTWKFISYAEGLVGIAERTENQSDFGWYYKAEAYRTLAIARKAHDKASAQYHYATRISNEYTDPYIDNELAEALAKADDYLQSVIEEIALENALFAQQVSDNIAKVRAALEVEVEKVRFKAPFDK